jgi:hypothetical protein
VGAQRHCSRGAGRGSTAAAGSSSQLRLVAASVADVSSLSPANSCQPTMEFTLLEEWSLYWVELVVGSTACL